MGAMNQEEVAADVSERQDTRNVTPIALGVRTELGKSERGNPAVYWHTS